MTRTSICESLKRYRGAILGASVFALAIGSIAIGSATMPANATPARHIDASICVPPPGWQCAKIEPTVPAAPVTLSAPFVVYVSDGDPATLPAGASATLGQDGTITVRGGLIIAPNSTIHIAPQQKKRD